MYVSDSSILAHSGRKYFAQRLLWDSPQGKLVTEVLKRFHSKGHQDTFSIPLCHPEQSDRKVAQSKDPYPHKALSWRPENAPEVARSEWSYLVFRVGRQAIFAISLSS
jgi:hypothetical protein